jgi:hypothetical protein
MQLESRDNILRSIMKIFKKDFISKYRSDILRSEQEIEKAQLKIEDVENVKETAVEEVKAFIGLFK